MAHYSNKRLTPYARRLRHNMTRHECHLWFDYLSKLPIRVRSQKPIGDYIVDFYCPTARLVIELDGSQHYEEAHEQKDALRDATLAGMGLKVLRYSNLDIDRRFEAVCEDIRLHIENRIGHRLWD